MTINTSDIDPQLLSTLNLLSTDQKLALPWYIYKEIGKSITPAAPGTSTASPAITEGIFGQVLEMSYEEQLQVQREIVERRDSPISRTYGSLSDTTKLPFWYLLARGINRSEVIPIPDDYTLEPQSSACLTQLQALEYSEQPTILRKFVEEMGVEPSTVSSAESDGL